VAKGLDTLIQMIFIDSFMHVDLHPGNILYSGKQFFTELDALLFDIEQDLAKGYWTKVYDRFS